MNQTKENRFDDIYEVVRLIPTGRVSTYGAIANYLGHGGARLVGWAMNASQTQKDIPAHRLVNRNGILTGKHHFENPEEMQKLLENEGLTILKDQIIDFQKYFWNPETELM